MDPYTPVRPRRSPRERLYRKQSWLGDTSVDEAGSSAEHSPSPAACSERRDDHLPAASTSVHVNDGAPSDALQPPEYPPLRETSSVQGPGTSSAPTHSCDMTNEVTPDEVMATGARGARCDPADCIPAHASVVRTGEDSGAAHNCRARPGGSGERVPPSDLHLSIPTNLPQNGSFGPESWTVCPVVEVPSPLNRIMTSDRHPGSIASGSSLRLVRTAEDERRNSVPLPETNHSARSRQFSGSESVHLHPPLAEASRFAGARSRVHISDDPAQAASESERRYLPSISTDATGRNAEVPRFKRRNLNLGIVRHGGMLDPLAWGMLWTLYVGHGLLGVYFDLNAMYTLVQIAMYPPYQANARQLWIFAAVGYALLWAVSVFVIWVGWGLYYLSLRRWNLRYPAIEPIYFSLAATTHLSLASFDHSTTLCSSSILRAGIVLAVLLGFWNPEDLVPPGNPVEAAKRDPHFFLSDSVGALTPYAKGVLLGFIAWVACRVVIVIVAGGVLLIFSFEPKAKGDAISTRKVQSEPSHWTSPAKSWRGESEHHWPWRERSRARIQDAFELCTMRQRNSLDKIHHLQERGTPSRQEYTIRAATRPPKTSTLGTPSPLGRQVSLADSTGLPSSPTDTFTFREVRASVGEPNSHIATSPGVAPSAAYRKGIVEDTLYRLSEESERDVGAMLAAAAPSSRSYWSPTSAFAMAPRPPAMETDEVHGANDRSIQVTPVPLLSSERFSVEGTSSDVAGEWAEQIETDLGGSPSIRGILAVAHRAAAQSPSPSARLDAEHGSETCSMNHVSSEPLHQQFANYRDTPPPSPLSSTPKGTPPHDVPAVETTHDIDIQRVSTSEGDLSFDYLDDETYPNSGGGWMRIPTISRPGDNSFETYGDDLELRPDETPPTLRGGLSDYGRVETTPSRNETESSAQRREDEHAPAQPEEPQEAISPPRSEMRTSPYVHADMTVDSIFDRLRRVSLDD